MYANLNELVDIRNGDLDELKSRQTKVSRTTKPSRPFSSDQLQQIVDFVNKHSKVFKYQKDPSSKKLDMNNLDHNDSVGFQIKCI